jgi:predicted nuclease of predicted toxin-antitoxin system
MKLLLDQGLPRSTVLHLRNHQIEAVHVGDRVLATATDSKILDVGRQEGMVVVTLDADFHALLALSGVTEPSVIRIRIEGLRGEDLAIASTAQQMSISFGVAVAGLATAFFIPSSHSNPTEMIHGIHRALIALGILSVLSTIVFCGLKSGDGDDVSLHKVLHPAG